MRIAFEEQHLDAIADVIVPSDTVVYAQEGTVLVPEETVEMLKKKRVPLTEVEGGNGSLPEVRTAKHSGYVLSRPDFGRFVRSQ